MIVLLAGFFGTAGSVALKVAFAEKDQSLLVTALMIGLAVLANCLQWLCFAVHLRESKQTAIAVALSMASGSISTALFGIFLFNEQYRHTWWLGMSLIIGGTALITLEEQEGKSIKVD